MSTRFSRVALAVALTGGLLACATGDSPTGPSALKQASALTDLVTDVLTIATRQADLLYCEARPAAVMTKSVGPAGGVLQAGGHKLTVPAGALSRQVTITMTAPSDTAATVQFLPEGLTFSKRYPATLTMSLSGCETPNKSLSILYVDDLWAVLEKLLTRWNPNAGTVTAELQHFSRYAVAW